MHNLLATYSNTDIFIYYTDGVIIGGSSLKHVTDNLDSFEDGPLDPGKKKTSALVVGYVEILFLPYRCSEGVWSGMAVW